MERFFLSRFSQVASGIIVGVLFGITVRPIVVQMIGPELFEALTTGRGFFVGLILVVIAVFVSLVVYTSLANRRGGRGGHSIQ